MNKIDKLLLRRIHCRCTRRPHGHAWSVFSPLKQTKETAENPAITQERIADDNRINATDQHQNFEPPLPDYEALARILKAEEEARRKAKEAEESKEEAWGESRKEWVERFPFEPIYYPEITFDPTVYDPNRKQPADDRIEGYWETRKMVKNHGFLKMFHKSRLPYTKEFEQLYDIVKEAAGKKRTIQSYLDGHLIRL